MLEVKNLIKDYVIKKDLSVRAINGINLNFRKNEFVAILGPSGCGKTTLLNIIGGLDRYTSGDLLIKNKSTKEYKDRDWDTYRNHSIGFVFQSYNLIPHQTVLKNVELALTISGISKKERRQRAHEALVKVDLEQLENNKPSQMSGGQMQRVAIARALVNNPEILLADEPTGALDSKTSISVMELLKEVAKDRLVIMVTHNPDLANKYATRIVNMFDGNIVGDTNPYKGGKETYDDVNKGKKHSQMKFFTAFGLSLANLFSKIKRTLLVAIAGSIGIVGVSSVLAISNGIKSYIASMQDDMLSSYPIGIAEESVDYTSLMSGLSMVQEEANVEFDTSKYVGLDSMISYLMTKYKDFTSVKTNDINANLLSYLDNIPEGAVAARKYNYNIDVTNNIFTPYKQFANSDETKLMSLNGITQMYISTLKTVNGFSDYAQFVDLFTDFMKQLPDNEEYVIGDGTNGQYKLLAGTYPKSANEVVIVVDTAKQSLTDILLAQLGMYPQDQFLNIAKKAIAQTDPTHEDYNLSQEALDAKYPYEQLFTFDSLLNKELIYYPHDSIYSYGEIEESSYRSITLSALVLAKMQYITLTYDFENDNYSGYSIGIGGLGGDTTSALSSAQAIYLSREKGSQKDDNLPQYGIFEGTFGENSVKYEISSTASGNVMKDITDADPSKQSSMSVTITDEIKPTETAFNYSASIDRNTEGGVKLKISGIIKANDETKFGCLSRGIFYTKAFADMYMKDAQNSKIISDTDHGLMSFIGSDKETTSSFKTYVTYDYTSYKEDAQNGTQEKGYAKALNADLTSSLTSLFSGATGGLDYFEIDKTYLRSLSGISVKKIDPTSTCIYSKEVEGVSYTFERLPQSISLFPTSFANKQILTDYLDKWNSDETITINGKDLTRENRDDLTYNDTIETIISVINMLIDIVSVALIIFTSLSLVVSCFMIAVITYISVMERVKEIGIIRSLGGRKKDVNRLFTAENLITGLTSGLIGVGFTYILQIIANAILLANNIPAIASLALPSAGIMILLSILLSVLSGALPSRNASKQNPVIALRTE